MCINLLAILLVIWRAACEERRGGEEVERKEEREVQGKNEKEVKRKDERRKWKEKERRKGEIMKEKGEGRKQNELD